MEWRGEGEEGRGGEGGRGEEHVKYCYKYNNTHRHFKVRYLPPTESKGVISWSILCGLLKLQ